MSDLTAILDCPQEANDNLLSEIEAAEAAFKDLNATLQQLIVDIESGTSEWPVQKFALSGDLSETATPAIQMSGQARSEPGTSQLEEQTAEGYTADLSSDPLIELTRLEKKGGPLTKRITLTGDGVLHSNGNACVMSSGTAGRVTFNSLGEFATFISDLKSNEAISLGALRCGLPDDVAVVTLLRIKELRSKGETRAIARSSEYVSYWQNRAALVVIDIDTKQMPPEVRDRIQREGGYSRVLKTIIPELRTCGRVLRRSTSAAISRTDTGEEMAGSDGLHIYVLVRDGADAERFLKTLHERCWLHGFGWMIVGAGGQVLERSLVDRRCIARNVWYLKVRRSW